MPNGSVGCVIERQKPASTFGSGVYPGEIQVMSVPSEKVSLSFGFVMALDTVTFREGVTPWLPFRRPRLSVARGSDRTPLLAC